MPETKTKPVRTARLNDDQLLAELKKTLPADATFKVVRMTSVNHKPHPYMIGPRHVSHASNHFGGILGDAAIEDAERNGIGCANRDHHGTCGLTRAEHTSERVVVVAVPNDRDEDLNKIPGLGPWLQSIKPLIEANGVAGWVFPRKAQADRV